MRCQDRKAAFELIELAIYVRSVLQVTVVMRCQDRKAAFEVIELALYVCPALQVTVKALK